LSALISHKSVLTDVCVCTRVKYITVKHLWFLFESYTYTGLFLHTKKTTVMIVMISDGTDSTDDDSDDDDSGSVIM
jgi:hypothetical protein